MSDLINLFDKNNVITITDEMIEEENREDLKKLVQNTAILNETMKDLNSLIEDSGNQIMEIEENVEDTNEILADTNVVLAKANKSQKTGNLIKITVIGGVIGLCLGGPLGGLAGWGISSAIAGVTAIVGSILGTITAGGTAYGIVKGKRDKAARDCTKAIEDRKRDKNKKGCVMNDAL